LHTHAPTLVLTIIYTRVTFNALRYYHYDYRCSPFPTLPACTVATPVRSPCHYPLHCSSHATRFPTYMTRLPLPARAFDFTHTYHTARITRAFYARVLVCMVRAPHTRIFTTHAPPPYVVARCTYRLTLHLHTTARSYHPRAICSPPATPRIQYRCHLRIHCTTQHAHACAALM